MHTTLVQVEEQVYKRGARIEKIARHFFIIHNGDWSGDIEIVEVDPTAPEGSPPLRTWTGIPGDVLIKAARTAVAEEIISMIEGEFQ